MPEVDFKDALKNGLRNDEYQDRNISFLTDAYNARPTRNGASPFIGLTQPFTYSTAHPFPQLFVGKRQNLVCYESGSGGIEDLSYNYSQTDLVLQPLGAYASERAFTAEPAGPLGPVTLSAGGGPWHFADHGESWMLTNGQAVVMRVPAITSAVTYFADETKFPLTCCSLNGRMILGGLAGLVSGNTAFKNAYGNLVTTTGSIASTDLADIDDSYVYWSSPGSDDFLWFFFEWMMTDIRTGGRKQDLLQEALSKNLFGFQQVPWQDAVWVTKPLGNGFVAYGEHGIAYFRQVGKTFEMREIATFGIADRGCVGGNDREHVFVTPKGQLYRLKADLSLEFLDYEEILDDMLSQQITISYNEQRREYYIANASVCYILTETGLGQSSHLVTSCQSHRGVEMGFFETATDTEMRLLSDTFDLGTRKVKTIRHFHITTDNPTDFSGIIHYRTDSGGAFSNTGYVQAFADGRIPLRASGTEFQVGVKCDVASGKRVENIVVQVDSKRRVSV